MYLEISLVVYWLRLCTFTAKGAGLIPGWGTKIPQVTQDGQKKKKKACLYFWVLNFISLIYVYPCATPKEPYEGHSQRARPPVARSALILPPSFSSDCVHWQWSQLTPSCGFCCLQRLMSLTFLRSPGSWDGFPWLSSRNLKPLSQPTLPFPFWTCLPHFRGWLPPASNPQGKNQWDHLYLLLLSPLQSVNNNI